MALDQLSGCLEAGDCLEGQETVVILASHHFGTSFASPHTDSCAYGSQLKLERV